MVLGRDFKLREAVLSVSTRKGWRWRGYQSKKLEGAGNEVIFGRIGHGRSS